MVTKNKILIIHLPRTGSTTLMDNISKEENIPYIFEPFDGSERFKYHGNQIRHVVKSPIYHKSIDFYLEFVKEFDKVILLSRLNLKECAESWAYLCEHGLYKSPNKIEGSNSVSKYTYKLTNNFEKYYDEIVGWNNDMKFISEKTNIPITYYEDIFDVNNKERYRQNAIT